MGLFSSSPTTTSTSSSAPSPSNDGAYIAPDRNQRQHCWDARDQFFACLDRNDIVDSIREKEKASKVCEKEERGLEGECARSWVRASLSFDLRGLLRFLSCIGAYMEGR